MMRDLNGALMDVPHRSYKALAAVLISTTRVAGMISDTAI
jgi:hypothetical protein